MKVDLPNYELTWVHISVGVFRDEAELWICGQVWGLDSICESKDLTDEDLVPFNPGRFTIGSLT